MESDNCEPSQSEPSRQSNSLENNHNPPDGMPDGILGNWVYELNDIILKIKSEMDAIMTPVASDCGLTKIQIMTLFAIANCEIKSVGDLSDKFGIEQGNASSLLKNMESKGVIKRRRRQSDERVVEVSLNPEGEIIVVKIFAAFAPYDKFLRSLPPERGEKILIGLRETLSLLDEMRTIKPILD